MCACWNKLNWLCDSHKPLNAATKLDLFYKAGDGIFKNSCQHNRLTSPHKHVHRRSPLSHLECPPLLKLKRVVVDMIYGQDGETVNSGYILSFLFKLLLNLVGAYSGCQNSQSVVYAGWWIFSASRTDVSATSSASCISLLLPAVQTVPSTHLFLHVCARSWLTLLSYKYLDKRITWLLVPTIQNACLPKNCFCLPAVHETHSSTLPEPWERNISL